MPNDTPDHTRSVNIQAGDNATLEGVAIGDRNKILNQVQAQGHVVVADDHSQVHIGDIYYYFEIPKTDVIHKDPYKFLSAYGLDDEDVFFGRTTAIEELSSLILSQKFVIVNGKSGSGKSSLIHAGVTPRLLRNNHLVIHVKEYLISPLDTIQAAISGGLESSLVIFLDQFERFFIYLPLEERVRFTTALKGWLDDTTSKVRFVVAIRMDFFGRIGEFQKVIRNIYQQSAIFTLEPLTRDEAREAIEGPLDKLGIRIVYDEALIAMLLDRLLEDAEIEPAQLQIVCDELYRRAKEQNVKILKEDGIYQELGGVEGMLKSYLQRKLKEYTPQDEAVKRVLKQMIAPVEVNAGIRSFVDVPQIATRLKVPETEVTPLLERLVDDRLIEKKETDGRAAYSLAHEYMAGQVQEWFDPKETAIRRARDILSHAMQYDVLLESQQAFQVKEYEQDLELNEKEQGFLSRSLNKHYRGVRFRRAVVAAISLLAIIASILGGFAYVQKKEADTQRETAIFQKDEAVKARDEAKRQLITNYFNNAVVERDNNNDSVKAAHYFMHAAELAAEIGESTLSKNAQLAGEILMKKIHLEAILEHTVTTGVTAVEHAVFSQDGRRILTVSRGGMTQVWDVSTESVLSDVKKTLLIKHEGPVYSAFSQDESRILTWGENTAQVWNSDSGQALTPPLVHQGYVGGAVFSQDGTRILTWVGGTAQVWDVSTSESIGEPLMLQHEGRVNGTVFSQDDTRILTWGDTAQVWNSDSGQALTPPLVHQGYVGGAVFSQAGTRILTWGGGTAQVWNVLTSESIGDPLILQHDDDVQGAVFNQDGTRILTWSADGTARVWDSGSGQFLIPPLEHQEIVIGSMFSQDESRILTWSGDDTARVWDSGSGQPLTPPLKHYGLVIGAVFSQDETRILTWSTDKTARVWDSSSGQALTPPLAHQGDIRGAIFSPDDTHILTWSDDVLIDNTARLWDVSTTLKTDDDSAQPLSLSLKHEDSLNGPVFSQDGTRILTWSGDTASVWNVSTESILNAIEGFNTGETPGNPVILQHKSKVQGAVFNQDGIRILTWSRDHTARVWDSGSGQSLTPPLEHEGYVDGAIFSQDGTRILTWGEGTVRIWDSDSGQPFTPFLENLGSVNVVPSQDGSRILTWNTSDGHEAQIWNSDSGQAMLPPLKHFTINGAAFSQDDSRILTTGFDKTVLVWDSGSGQALTPPLVHQGYVEGAVFSQDGTRILSWSENTVYVWDSDSGKPLTPPLQHQSGVLGAVFSQDGTCILTWSGDDTARVWGSGSGQPLTPPLQHKDYVKTAVFSQDETRILTWTQDDTLWVWKLPADEDLPRNALILQVEVQTGTRLNEGGGLEFLSSQEWWEKRRHYEKIAQNHLKECQYPYANLFLNDLMNRPESCESLGAWLQEVNPDVVQRVASAYSGICLRWGNYYLNRKDYDSARRAFENTLQLRTASEHSRKLAEAYERIARTLIESWQDVEQGMQYVHKSLELNPDQNPARAVDTLALGYIKQGSHAEAVELLEQALENAPDEESRQTLKERLQQALSGLE